MQQKKKIEEIICIFLPVPNKHCLSEHPLVLHEKKNEIVLVLRKKKRLLFIVFFCFPILPI